MFLEKFFQNRQSAQKVKERKKLIQFLCNEHRKSIIASQVDITALKEFVYKETINYSDKDLSNQFAKLAYEFFLQKQNQEIDEVFLEHDTYYGNTRSELIQFAATQNTFEHFLDAELCSVEKLGENLYYNTKKKQEKEIKDLTLQLVKNCSIPRYNNILIHAPNASIKIIT